MGRVRLLPSDSRRRGGPAIGFDLFVPDEVVQLEVEGEAQGPVEASLAEYRDDGKMIATMTIELFTGSLVVDRDGVLHGIVATAAEQAGGQLQRIYPVEYEAGACGFRADIVRADRPELPYQSWLALAATDFAVQGGALVTIASLPPSWAAGAAILDSLRVFSRDSDARARSEPLALPFIKG